MTRRAGQWDLVGRSSDPVPADREDVEAVADDFDLNGNVMTAASNALKQLANGSGWIGDAAKEFAGEADETYGDLGKAASKYTDAAAALRSYAVHVGTARDETAKALAEAETAHADKLANQTNLLDGVDDPSDEQKDAEDDRQGRYDDAVSALGTARTRLDHAVETLDSHAATCANRISDASENFKDSRMDDIKGAVSSVLKVLVTALNVIAIVLAVVIVILLVFTSIALGPFLMAAFIIGAAIFALTTVQWAMGDATGKDVAWASLGLIGGGVGRLAGTSVRALAGAARISLIARSGRQAIRALPMSVRFGRFVPIQSIRVWANGQRSTAAFSAMRQTMRTIDGTATNNPVLRALQIDDVADSLRSINVMRDLDPGMINSIRLTMAQVGNGGVLLGTGMELTAQGHDILDLPGAVMDFPQDWDNLQGDWGDMMDGQPDRTIDVPPLPDPLPSHVAPAGR